VRLSQQNVSFSDEELDIRSPRLVPLISYPHFSECEYKDRIIEMESLGITSIILGGKTIVNNTHVTGKGCVGIVVKAKAGSTVCALKIRRTDADRKTMDEEARFHKIANSIGVGPRLEDQTKNLIAMEFVDGQNIVDWIAGTTSKSRMCSVARSILEQCFTLDRTGIDHGELSRLARHVIVSEDRTYIIDFESASTARKTSNVTSAAQSIFLYGTVSNSVKRILGSTDTEEVIDALRTYKHFHTRANFDAVVNSLSI
jgi:putative serine/threonine protein kinase